MFGGVIVARQQDRSSLLECKYIFLLGLLFSLAAKNNDEPKHSSLSFLFCFCALREDDDKLVFVIVYFLLFLCTQRRSRPVGAHHHFFCFDSMHTKKTMMSRCLLSSCFVLFMCTQRRQQ